MHLRHRHGDTTRDAGEAQQREQGIGMETQRGRRPRRRGVRSVFLLRREPPSQNQGQRQHGEDADDADDHLGRAPPGCLDEALHDRRPDRAAQIIARCANGDRDAAPAREPVRDVGDQRREARRAADADQQVGDGEPKEARRQSRRDEGQTEGQRRPDHRHHDAEAVDQPADEHGAAAEAQHRQRVGQGRIGAGHIEFRLHGGQRHHHRPHADAADAADQQRRRQAHPGVGGLHLSVASIADCLCRSVHGRATICGKCPRVKLRLPAQRAAGMRAGRRRPGSSSDGMCTQIA